MINQPTGYPSIDKPWLKYYSEEAINSPLPEGSMYDYICNCNKNRLDKAALNYFGKKITHRSLQENVDACAKALVANGVKPGDFVSCCVLAIPETVYLFYAINKIGAISVKAPKIKKNRKFVLWKEFLKKGKNRKIPNVCINSEKTAVIEYTGGTTGDPKGVMLSNKGVNALALNYISASDILEFKEGQTYLDIIPPFLGYGLFFGIHMPLCAGL